MTVEVFWFIPTHGDGRFLGTTEGARPATFDYLSIVARAADSLGFRGVLLPTGRGCEDAWVTAAALSSITTRLKFLIAVRPGLISPTLAHRMATTFDRLSGGRVMINVVTGGDTEELNGDGIFLSHDERYAQTDEFLSIWRGLTRGETVDFTGKYQRVKGARLFFPPVQTPHIPLYFGGSSPAALKVAARHVDFYLSWGEPPEQVGEKIARVRQLASEEGRSIRFGIRLHTIVRDTTEEARAAADQLISRITPEVLEAAQKSLDKYDSDGQRRMLALHRGNRSALWLLPDLWAGVGLVRGGAGTAMVGDGETVARLMNEYRAMGIDTFILSGYPHLDEAYRFAEHVFPRINLSSHGSQPPRNNAILGEVVANGAVGLGSQARPRA